MKSLYILSFVFHVIVAMEDRKCPKTCPVEKPDLCVRVKYMDGKGKYTSSMSVCQLERVSCRKDVITMIVPLKYCFENRNGKEKETSKRKKSTTQKLGNLVTEGKRRKRSMEGHEQAHDSEIIAALRQEKTSFTESGKEEKITSKMIKPTRTQLANLGTEVKRRKRYTNDRRQLQLDPCFRQCPVRNQLVCARCEHGVFRTFMSLCHLREHQCRRRKDRIELVARRPCAGTGLYFELPRPVRAVAEPGDADPVLEYIYSVLDTRAHVTINPDGARDSKGPRNRWPKIHRTKARTST